MKELNLPQYSFKISVVDETEMIFDPIRKKYVKLTEEEWVRQNFIQYIVQEGKYAAGLIGVEVAFPFNRMKRRIDILIHNRMGDPVMIIECKAPGVNIDDKVFDQIVNYNMEYKVPYIVVTNGIVHYVCKVDHENKKWEFLNIIPLYEDLQ